MSARRDRRLPGGLGVLIGWALHELETELGLQIRAAGFGRFDLRCLAQLAITTISARPGSIMERFCNAYQKQPDLTLRILTIVRQRVPLPCSKTKKLRVWSFMLSPNRVFVDTEKGINGTVTPKGHWTKSEAPDGQLAFATAQALKVKIDPQEVSNLRRELLAELEKRNLLPSE